MNIRSHAGQVAVRKKVGGGSFVCGLKRIVTPHDTLELHGAVGKSFAQRGWENPFTPLSETRFENMESIQQHPYTGWYSECMMSLRDPALSSSCVSKHVISASRIGKLLPGHTCKTAGALNSLSAADYRALHSAWNVYQ